MSRGLKFRAWSKSKKEFIAEGFTLLGEMLSTGALLCTCFENGVDIDDLEITQWTGLRDKTGKDVYIGDIYMDTMEKFVVEDGEYDFEGLRYYGIHSKMLNEKYNNYSSPLSLDDSGVIEVIGNIYQTTENNG
jgi:uncharacterized phage protein (TIGR01671 family)